jgi:hypothetical protein
LARRTTWNVAVLGRLQEQVYHAARMLRPLPLLVLEPAAPTDALTFCQNLDGVLHAATRQLTTAPSAAPQLPQFSTDGTLRFHGQTKLRSNAVIQRAVLKSLEQVRWNTATTVEWQGRTLRVAQVRNAVAEFNHTQRRLSGPRARAACGTIDLRFLRAAGINPAGLRSRVVAQFP